MAVGQVTEAIEVSSEAPLLQADSAAVSTIIDARRMKLCRCHAATMVQLTLLSPGAVTPIRPASIMAIHGQWCRPFSNGNREQSNNFILDGHGQ